MLLRMILGVLCCILRIEGLISWCNDIIGRARAVPLVGSHLWEVKVKARLCKYSIILGKPGL